MKGHQESTGRFAKKLQTYLNPSVLVAELGDVQLDGWGSELLV